VGSHPDCPGNLGLVDVIIPAGVTQIYGTWVTTTPLPTTWTMMLIGFVGFGFLAYRGTKKCTALAAA
jgi:hypothetical protein